MTVHETLGKVQEETWGNTYQQEQWESEWSRAEPSCCQDERSSCVRQTDFKIIRRDRAHSKHTTHWAELNFVQAHAEIQIMLYNVCQTQIMFIYKRISVWLLSNTVWLLWNQTVNLRKCQKVQVYFRPIWLLLLLLFAVWGYHFLLLSRKKTKNSWLGCGKKTW